MHYYSMFVTLMPGKFSLGAEEPRDEGWGGGGEAVAWASFTVSVLSARIG